MGLPQKDGSSNVPTTTVYYTGSAALTVGTPVFYIANADPSDSTLAGKDPGVAVEASPSSAADTLFAGVTVTGYDTDDVPGYIEIVTPSVNDVVTVAVAVGIDAGDGGVLTNSQAYLADGGAYDGSTDQFRVLYDEDNANNPHGTSAISSSVGLVEAVYTGPV